MSFSQGDLSSSLTKKKKKKKKLISIKVLQK